MQAKIKNILIVLFALFCGFIVYFPLTDSDIWWHLAAGREIIKTNHLLLTDPFSFTSNGATWFDLHWIFQLAMFGLFQFGGVKALVLFKCILFSLTSCLLLFACTGKRNVSVSIIVFAAILYEVRFLVTERPVLFTLLFLSLCLFFLERYFDNGKLRNLAILFPLQILWTNSQGLFLLGPALAGIYIVAFYLEQRILRNRPVLPNDKKEIVRLLLFLSALVASCLINPFVFSGIAFPLRLLQAIVPVSGNVYSANISENIPLLSMVGTGDARYVYAVLVVTVGAVASMFFNKNNLKLAHVFLVLTFLVLAYMAQRNILLYFCVVAPVICFNVSAGLGAISFPPKGQRIINIVSVSAALLFLAAYSCAHAAMLSICPSHEAVSPFRFPDRAVQFLNAHPVTGNILNADRYGGYLLWYRFPQKKVFIDGRFTLRSQQFFKEYLTLLDEPEKHFDSIVAQYGITHVLLQTSIFYNYMNLAKTVFNKEHWKLVYADGSSALFTIDSLCSAKPLALDSAAVVDSILKDLQIRWKDDPFILRESFAYCAQFLGGIGEEKSGQYVLGRMVR